MLQAAAGGGSTQQQQEAVEDKGAVVVWKVGAQQGHEVLQAAAMHCGFECAPAAAQQR
jgi:hypothetical protein